MSSNSSDVDWIVKEFKVETERRMADPSIPTEYALAWGSAYVFLLGLRLGLEQATRVANARCRPIPDEAESVWLVYDGSNPHSMHLDHKDALKARCGINRQMGAGAGTIRRGKVVLE